MGAAYVYYSYEQWGRGYIGVRKRDPVGDDAYMGSYSDPNFHPTQKIIIGQFDTYAEALEVEQKLHIFFGVVKSSHFANRAVSGGKHFATESPEQRKRRSERRIGWKWSDEVRMKMSESAKRRGYSESRAESKRGNTYTRGRYWITDGKTSRMINPDDLLPDGWRRGRHYGKRSRRGGKK